jgi:PAS domain S-box-containing protein
MHIYFYFLTVLFSAFLMAGLAIWAWQYRKYPGVIAFVLSMIASSFYALFYGFEVTAVSLDAKWLFYRFQYFGISFFSPFLLLFALRFAGEAGRIRKRWLLAIFIIPLITFLLALTNDFHHFFIRDINISHLGPFPALTFIPAAGYWIFQSYNIICISLSLTVFIRMLWVSAPAFRNQYSILVASIALPFPVYILYLIGVFPAWIDPLPYALAFAGLIIAFGLSRFRLFSMAPVARNVLFDEIPDPVVVFDVSGAVLDYNRMAAKRFGINQKLIREPYKIVFQNFPGVIHFLNNRHPNSQSEISVDGVSGTLYFNCTHVAVPGNFGMDRGFMVIMQDISNRKKTEILKNENEAKFRQIVENAPLGIYYFNLNGHIQLCNEPFVEIIGSSKEKIIGIDLKSLPDPNVRNATSEVLMGRKSAFEGDYRSVTANKTTPVKVLAVPVLDESGKVSGGIGIVEDISDRRLAEEAIKLKTQELETTNAEKDRFFSIIAHDLKSPLFALMGLSDMATDLVQDIKNPEIISLTEGIRTSAHSLYNLLDNLLVWAKMQRGLIKVHKEEFNINKTVTEIEFLFKESVQRKSISFHNNLPADLVLSSDEKMISSIFRNLISNAIKFTPGGGTISVDVLPSGNGVMVFTVSDTGVGISSDKVEKLFAIGQKVYSSGTNGEPGSGLGLMLCKEFAAKLGADIYVESQPGSGSTFYLNIPAVSIRAAKN